MLQLHFFYTCIGDIIAFCLNNNNSSDLPIPYPINLSENCLANVINFLDLKNDFNSSQ